MTSHAPPNPLRVLADGSFRLVLRAFGAGSTGPFQSANLSFGASSVLARTIANGHEADLFLSADPEEAARVAPEGTGTVAFATDTLVAVARPEIRMSETRFLDVLLDWRIRVGIGAPGSDAEGALVEQLYARAEACKPGAGTALREKSRVIQAGPDGPGARRTMEKLFSGEVDVALGRRSMLRNLSGVADLITPPEKLAASLTCTLVILAADPARRAAAQAYVAGLLDLAGQAKLSRHGFGLAPPPV